MRRRLALAIFLLGCGKTEAMKAGPKPEPSSPPLPSAMPTSTSSVVPAMTATAMTSIAPPALTHTVASASAVIPTASAPLQPGAGMHFDGNHFAVDVATPGPCDRDTECKLAVRLTAKDEFHVNKEYPYGLKMDDSPAVAFLGTDARGKGTFSKTAGDFAFDGEKAAVMTVRFRPGVGGALAMSGTLKLSVCNAANCLLDTAQVHATVPVR